MKKTPIREEWLSYRNEVLPTNAGANQLIETRRAFYAGARALYTHIMVGLTPGDEVNEPDLQLMQDIDDELREFVEQIKAGTA